MTAQMKYAIEGTDIPEAATYLDEARTKHIEFMFQSHGCFEGGDGLREAAEKHSGTWSRPADGHACFEVLNLPYKDGTLVIEAPYIIDKAVRGHRVAYCGGGSVDAQGINVLLFELVHEEQDRWLGRHPELKGKQPHVGF